MRMTRHGGRQHENDQWLCPILDPLGTNLSKCNFVGKNGFSNEEIESTEKNMIQTKDPKFTLRFATPEDAGLVVIYMKKLGAFQKMLEKITATEEGIHKLLLDGKGEAVLGITKDRPLASFISARTLPRSSDSRGCERLEWGCLDWNEPTIRFYRNRGAYSVDAMTIFRFSPDQLKVNAGRF